MLLHTLKVCCKLLKKRRDGDEELSNLADARQVVLWSHFFTTREFSLVRRAVRVDATSVVLKCSSGVLVDSGVW